MKNLKWTVLLPTLCMICLSSCSQKSFLIKHCYAYKTVRMVGRKPIDINGNEVYRPADTTVFIYVETKGNKPVWEHAWNNNQLYNINATLMNQPSVEIGTDKSTQKKIYLTPAKENQLWKLELSPSSDHPRLPSKRKLSGLSVQGRYNHKQFECKIEKITEVVMPDAG